MESSTSHTAYLITVSAVYGGDGLILRVQHNETLLHTARLYCFYLQVIFKGLAAYEG